MLDLFFEFIRVAIGTGEKLSTIPTSDQWRKMYALSVKQTIIGVCFNGIDVLVKNHSEQVVNLPRDIKMRWLGLSASIQHKNELLNHRCSQLSALLLADGIRSCILKGQGVAMLYKKELQLLRQSGDIDIWLDASRESIIEYVMKHAPTADFDQKHIQFHIFDDVDVEMHWVPVKRNSPKFDIFLGGYFESQKQRQFSDKVEVNYPTVDFQLVHQLLHVYGHYLYEGVGLRQLMDLYFAQIACVKKMPEKIDAVLALFKRLRILKFVAGTQWVLREVYANKADVPDWLIYEPDENEGKKLMSEIVLGGNFGQFDSRNIVDNESFAHRFWRRWGRKWRMWRYDFVGTLIMPIKRLKLELWMRVVRKKYNVEKK